MAPIRENQRQVSYPLHLDDRSPHAKILISLVVVRIFNRLLDHALSVDTYGMSFLIHQ